MPVRSMRPAGDQVEVVLDAVLAHALDLLDAERVGADPADLLEVERAPLPAAGRVDAALHERAPRLQHPDLDLERLGLADGVVGDVDPAGVAHREAAEALHRRAAARRPTRRPAPRPSPAAAPRRNTRWAPSSVGQRRPGRRSGRRRRPRRRGRGRAGSRPRSDPSAPGAPHERPAAGRRRVAGDAVQRHRERVGEDGVLVVDARRGPGTASTSGPASARRSRRSRRSTRRCGCPVLMSPVGEAPAQAEVAGLARRAERRRCRGARTTATG